MVLVIVYKKNNAGFIQTFNIRQNGQDFNISNLSGVVTVVWWFKKESPGSEPKYLKWTGTPSGANNSKVQFSVTAGFFNESVDYDSDIEIYNDGTLILHTRPSFIVRIEETAGDHTEHTVT